LSAYDEIAREFTDAFGRRHDAVETYHTEDADLVFVMVGSFATKAREAVDRLRQAGWKVGLVRPRLLRPFPEARLRELLAGKRGAVVIDQNLSMGKGGVLHTELASALYGQPNPPVLVSFVGGLGGRDISPEEFFEMAKVTRRAAEEGQAPRRDCCLLKTNCGKCANSRPSPRWNGTGWEPTPVDILAPLRYDFT
jgi:pyruvate ferredoxin oxidoreductase alpha subunit